MAKIDVREFVESYNVPRSCKQCEGVMVYQGVGEYQCEECGFVDWDDYGKARNYLEKHKGANAAEIEKATGVSQRSIRRMLKESRLEIADGSRVYMNCEICSKTIRSGRFCEECEKKVHRNLEAQYREVLHADMRVYGRGDTGETGQRRFMREVDD